MGDPHFGDNTFQTRARMNSHFELKKKSKKKETGIYVVALNHLLEQTNSRCLDGD